MTPGRPEHGSSQFEIQSRGLGSPPCGYRSPAACPRRPAAAFMRPTVREALACGRQPAL